MEAEASTCEHTRRIAIVMHGFSGGGMERSMLRLVDDFSARGLLVDFVVGQAVGELVADVPASVLPLWHDLP